MSTSQTTEKTFETVITEFLVEKNGYTQTNPQDFNRELALDTKTLFSFLQETQSNEWQRSLTIHGNQIEQKLLDRLTQEIDNRGVLDVIRNGFTDLGVRYKLSYFQPASKLNADAYRLYKFNKFTVTRQLKYSLQNENSLDMVIGLNGFPIVTVELKNQFTNQTVENAKKQYVDSRDPHELIFQFKKRSLVHFAVDTDQAYMTTKIDGDKTKYLPFNLGYNNGGGNPPNSSGYKTSYLWEVVWSKDILLEIIQRFLHLHKETVKIDGRDFVKESLIFPRYHQLDCVRKIVADAKLSGTGKNYLIQHSAGSGKSNSIAWLSYHLASLHNENDQRIFDSVIVVTDRKILDQQLQDTIYQYEHKAGVVQKIDKDSTQLAKAISDGTNIIITTLQKFPFVLGKIVEKQARNYAIIVDEAHSSQSGEASKKLKEALTVINLDDAVKEESILYESDYDEEDEIRESMLARGPQKNLSFFGFTATPKAKTLEVFGVKDPDTGKPVPFHLYSMRQAIEEGFILDILKNYTTYKTYYRLSKSVEEDPLLNKKKVSRAIARFLSLHPHNLSQKTEVIIEHFRQVTLTKLGGKAKAMVVTSSRLHVVRYKQEFDKYIKEKGYTEIKALVAFSGSLKDEYDLIYTESEMNGFGEKELPEKFNTSSYNILLVADKYQTGFDQPLLHTMYVDKKLSGVKAVQTLSRLNRTHLGKEDTFILDFANETEEILHSFQPYYELTTVMEVSNPNQLFDLKHKIEEYQIILQSEVESFCKVFFKSSQNQSVKDHQLLNAYIDPAVDRFTHLEPEDKQEDYKHLLISFVRLYAFLAQIMPFADAELEKFYAYAKLLITKLPKRNIADRFKLHDEVALEYYRLQKISEGTILLEKDKVGEIKGPTDIGDNKDKDEFAKLSEIIEILNVRFGTEFTTADKCFFDGIEEELVLDEMLQKQAKSNTIDNFKYGFEDKFLQKLIDRMDKNTDIFDKITSDSEFSALVKDWMLKKVYTRLTK